MLVPTLATERLVLRQFRESDAAGLCRLALHPEITRFLANRSVDLRAHAAAVRTMLTDEVYPDGLGSWVVTEPDGLIVGRGHLRPSSQLPGLPAEIGWFLSPDRWGRGLAREATEALIRHGFDTVRLPAIWALVHEDNIPSLGLAKRLGFQDSGSGEHYGATHRRLVLLR
ncbi:GNAT family N-acetyltransferase [Fodinicola feengrottensis]|uniref:N-acetyltransferase domain-containing protein n=1 Tax=Fodinicola feengrottensis TaxID=435914 RepID=A0ABP4RZ22_9ACTN|nr:GNAT family N-acetyltransferase [Fodinicola feengrottensis]